MSFTAPERLLLGPGPTNTDPRILQAMAEPTVGHLDPWFQALMEDIKSKLRTLMKTKNVMTMPLSAPASLAMEMGLVNILEPSDKAIIAQNGVFGGRMADIVKRAGAQLVLIEFDWGKPVDPEIVEATMKDHPDAKLFGFVHAETSTGVRSDAQTLCALARQYEMFSFMDTVTGLGGIEVDVDGWGADIVYSGSQKCLGVPPGIAPITFSDAACAAVQARKTPVQSWFLDLNLLLGYWSGEGARTYHHTAPVNMVYALYEGLVLVEEEGLQNRIDRHAQAHQILAQGLAELNLDFFVESELRLPQLNTITIPEGADDAGIRSRLLKDHNIEIGAGLGPMAGKIWRIGLMGPNANQNAVQTVLDALKTELK